MKGRQNPDMQTSTPNRPLTSAPHTEKCRPLTSAPPVAEYRPLTSAPHIVEYRPLTPAPPVEEYRPLTSAPPVEEYRPQTPPEYHITCVPHEGGLRSPSKMRHAFLWAENSS